MQHLGSEKRADADGIEVDWLFGSFNAFGGENDVTVVAVQP